MSGRPPVDARDAVAYVASRIADSSSARTPTRTSVRDSWQRAAQAGLIPSQIHAPYDPNYDADSRLRWAAAPALTAVSADLPDLPIALLLADERSHVIGRWMQTTHHALLMDAVGAAPGFICAEELIGTNSIGLAAYSEQRTVVRGFEHYADALTHVSCGSAPVRDPTSGTVVGVVNVTSTDPAYSPIVPALIGRVVYETEQRLGADGGRQAQPLFDAFLTARRGAKGPLVAVNANTMFVNTAAGTMVGSADRERLWLWAQHSTATPPVLDLESGALATRSQQVFDGPANVGALIWLQAPLEQSLPARYAYAFALTASERSIAEHVAAGLTNREVAAALSISPHTVDYHLRQIFQKLNLQSRVELARLVTLDATTQRDRRR